MCGQMSAFVVILVGLQTAVVPQGTLRGRVLDPDGQPKANAHVTVLELVEGEFRATRSLTTSADGKFEAIVTAGRVMVKAQPQAVIVGDEPRLRRFVTHPPAYFPGVLDEREAWPIDVKPGEIVEFDLTLPPVPVGSIKTIVSGPDGHVIDYLRVTRPEAKQIRTVKMVEDGVGYVEGLREGRYIVSARARSRDEMLAAWAMVHLISGEVAVSLDLKPVTRVVGRIISERDGLPPLATTRVSAAWTDGTIDLDPLARDESHVTPDGSFTIDAVFGTRMFRVAGLADGWRVVAVRHGRSDITSSGLDLAPGATVEITIIVARK
jgi:hypothetical protein